MLSNQKARVTQSAENNPAKNTPIFKVILEILLILHTSDTTSKTLQNETKIFAVFVAIELQTLVMVSADQPLQR